jgi:hypothetical protein
MNLQLLSGSMFLVIVIWVELSLDILKFAKALSDRNIDKSSIFMILF